MKLWIEFSHPKDVLFFKGIINEMKIRGHKLMLTTRNDPECIGLIQYFKLPIEIIGTWGKDRVEKLNYGTQRMTQLFHRFKDEKIDAVITLCNPEVNRIAFGLGFPIFNFIDIPEADAVCRLCLPLSKTVLIPFHVDRSQIYKYWNGNIFIYDCFDPSAWMPGEPSEYEKLGVKIVKRPFIIYRSLETKASYYENFSTMDLSTQIVKQLEKEIDAHFYPVSRYNNHEIVDMQSLLFYSDLFIGGGGTMNIESIYWGVPTISCRPFSTSYDRWLESNGYQIHVKTVDEGVKIAKKILEKEPAHNFPNKISEMKFPLKEVCDLIEDVKNL